ncbi:MAG: 6-phosphogluconolactonase [Tepidiformaceae bacterium]
MALEVRVCEPGGFGDAAADALLEAASGVRAPVVGLATGNTPLALYDALARRVQQGEAAVSAWRPFAIDEYGGARGHPCSNRSYFARHWDSIPGARPVLQFEPQAADPAAEAARFRAALAAAGGLDVVLLGIGRNGHFAFNEPGSARDSVTRLADLAPETRAAASACWGELTPRSGYTLGLGEILAARRVVLLADGHAKAAIVARALAGPIGPECPASFLREHPAAVVVLDVAAAAGLRSGSAQAGGIAVPGDFPPADGGGHP